MSRPLPRDGEAPAVVAYVLPTLESGGTENHVLRLAARLDRSRFSPVVYATAEGGSLRKEFDRLGIPVCVLDSRLSPNRVGVARSLRSAASLLVRLPRLLRADRTAIVHAYLPAANVIGPLAARLCGARACLVSKRSLCDYKAGRPLLASMENLGNLLADAILVNSDAVRRDVSRIERFTGGKFRKIYNGVDLPERRTEEERLAFRAREGIAADAPLAVAVSNFFAYKGHDVLVRAAARLASRIPGARLALVGRDSGTLEAVRALARGLGLSETVLFPGERADVPDFLRAADLFVHPSRQEGFSNAILEAMAAGLPVVACDVGGNAEAIVHGETGLLVPAGDDAAMADALGALLADPARSKAMGDAGRARAAAAFPLDGMVREMEALYGSLLAKGAGGTGR